MDTYTICHESQIVNVQAKDINHALRIAAAIADVGPYHIEHREGYSSICDHSGDIANVRKVS